MRRFELSEGTSNKFWQIALDGAAFTVTWGRIGTNGQTQTKTFDSATKAQKEHDKLVEEKVKKGYAEVGSATSSAPAAKPTTPKPAPARTTVVDQGRNEPAAAKAPAPPEATRAPAPRTGAIAWTEAALREAAPIRGSEVLPPRRLDAKGAYARLAKAMAAFGTAIERGVSQPGALSDAMKSAREAFSFDHPPARLDIDAQAAACALIGPKLLWGDKSRTDDFVRYWAGVEGATFAARALAKALAMPCQVADQGNLSAPNSVALVIGEPRGQPWYRKQELPGWRGMRQVAALADGAAHADLMREVQELQRTAPVEARAVFAVGLEHAEWMDSDVAAIRGNAAPGWFWPLLTCMPSVDAVEAILNRTPGTGGASLTALDDLRFDVVARYGPSAAPLLRRIVTSAGPSGVDRVRSIAEALALIVTRDVAEFFIGQLGEKSLRPVAAGYLQAHPEVSVAPLAVAALSKGATAEVARAVLKPIVASLPEDMGAIGGELSPAAHAVVDGLRKRSGAVEEASTDALPRVLANPPWAGKLKVADVEVLALDPLPFEETMCWKPGEQHAASTMQAHWLAERPADVYKNADLARQASKTQPVPGERSWNMASSSTLAQLPKATLLELLPSLNLARFSWSYYPVIQTLVARHGVEMIDFALRAAACDSVAAVEALARARSPRVAPLMAEAWARMKKAKPLATEWLLAFPDAAAVGLVPVALGKPGRDREYARGALRFVASRGHRAHVDAVGAKHGDAAANALRAVLDFDPLLTFPAKLPKLPAFWNAAGFSRPVLRDTEKALPLSAVDALGTMLAFTDIVDPYPGIAQVKEACEPASLAAFAWDLFQAWLIEGGPSKESWAFTSLALLGDDDCARKLTALVRQWPGEAAHARAVVGLDVLARIGTDVALMNLHGISQKVAFKGLKDKAREKIDEIAEARGLSAEELADRLVPDLGLDDDGSLTLDLGPRAFRVGFDESLKPYVLDGSGKRVADLPKPGKSDDAEKAGAAVETWKAIKKDARTIASSQVLRLELAMCAQRRWAVDVFRPFLLEHPLMVHLVRRLVWGAYDADGRLLSTFRVAEDRTLANETDDAYSLPGGARVGIPHRLELGDALAARWGQVFGDYELIQPFTQLSRETFVPSAEEQSATELHLVKGLKVPTGKVLGLDGRGWRRGAPQDAGVVCWYEKPLSDGTAVHLGVSGIYTGMIAESPEQELGEVVIQRGDTWDRSGRVPFGTLPPVLYSELVRDLYSLRP